MMRHLLEKRSPIRMKCFVAAFYLVSGSVFAQNTQEIKAIKKKTEIQSLNKLQKNVSKEIIPLAKLQKIAKEKNIPFKGTFEGKQFQLKGFDKEGNPRYYTTYNADAAKAMSITPLHSIGGVYNLDGDGIIVHEWDGDGVLLSHQELAGRVVQKDTPSGTHEHSTHVAGTMIASGINASAKGMLPKATLYAYDWDNDISESIEAAKNGAIISNHSYGDYGGFEYNTLSGRPGWHWMGKDEDTEYINYGRYNSEDAKWDILIKNAPYYLPVKAAGNSRGNGPNAGQNHYVRKTQNGVTVWVSSNKNRLKNGGEFGYDTLVSGTNGKNILVVGAAQKIPNGYQNPTDVVPASFSVFGPTDDGRIKPDIMGVGVNIFSTVNTANDGYDTMSGTSMASPAVAGSLGIFQQHYKNLFGVGKSVPFMKATTLKALAIHTADEAGTSKGPNYQTGWGLLNGLRGVETISVKDKYSLIEEKTLQNNGTETINVVASGNEPIKVTIVWNDPAPIVAEPYTLNDRTPRLVNDLDIRVSDGTNTFYPWVLDPNNPANPATNGDNILDNVEQIVIENPIKGQNYTITVSHKGKLQDNEISNSNIKLKDATEQDYSIIVSGINQGVSKDVKIKAIEVPSSSEFSERTPVVVKIENIGNQDVVGAKLKYQLINTDENNETVFTDEIDVENISAGASLDKVIELNLSKSFVNYSIVAEIIWTEDEVKDNNKVSALAYGILADLTQENSRYDYGFETGFQQNGWTTQDVDDNGDTWGIFTSSDYARTGIGTALNYPAANGNGTDDWLFSNPIKLKANTEYRVVVNARNDNTVAGESEPLLVAFGKKAEDTEMIPIETIDIESEMGYQRQVFTFTPTETGIYYIGFNHQKDKDDTPYGIMLDDISIQYADSVPMPEFVAFNTTPNTIEPVIISSEIESPETDPAETYEWIFEPSDSVTFLDGTTPNDPDIIVSFGKEISYDVTLKATNTKGEGVFTKKSYIKPMNVPVSANFAAEQIYVYQGDTVSFRNTSMGVPEPNQWKWTFTPSEGIEYLNGTSENSKQPEIKFRNVGLYSVKLQATSPINDTDTIEYKDLIEVRGVHNEVRNLTYDFNTENKAVNLKWDLPYQLPTYAEGFEKAEENELPDDFTQIDEDGDQRRWRVTFVNSYKGRQSVASLANNRAVDTKNWLITGKVEKGAEELRFWRAGFLPQGLEVYFVPVSGVSGNAPTVSEISTSGTKLYDETSSGQSFKEPLKYSEIRLDISALSKNEDFYIAFLHKKKKEDIPAASTLAHFLQIDEIEIGSKAPENSQRQGNSIPKIIAKSVENSSSDKKVYGENPKQDIEPVVIEKDRVAKAVLSYPRLVGYQVVKNGTLVKEISNIEERTYSDVLSESATYDVYAVYSDREKSKERSVIIDINALNTLEGSVSQFKVYPNPSDGIFTVELQDKTDFTHFSVYDLSGRLLLDKQYKGDKIVIDLTNYGVGTYILKMKGNKEFSTKLIVK